MKLYYIILLCMLSTVFYQSEAQSFIGKKKKTILLADKTEVSPLLVFNKNNICIREMYEYDNLEDCNKQVAKIIQDTGYGWIRINENQIVSNFSHQRLIEILEINKGCRVQIHQTAWTKKLYELLLSK